MRLYCMDFSPGFFTIHGVADLIRRCYFGLWDQHKRKRLTGADDHGTRLNTFHGIS